MKTELLHDIVAGMRNTAMEERKAFMLREARVRAWVRDDAWKPRASDDFEGCTE